MDYYESTRPEVDDSGLSGGVAFKLGGQIASVSTPISYVGANYQRNLDGSNALGTTLTYDYPFKISTKVVSGQLSISVFSDSYLFDSTINSSNLITISNLDTYINCNNNDYIWLELDISGFSITHATIKTVGNGGSFTGGGIYVTNGNLQSDGGDPPSQIYARKLLAYVKDGKVQPIVVTSLGMSAFCANGIASIFPVPV